MIKLLTGKDNYPADVVDDAFFEDAYSTDDKEPLNAGYYHRFVWLKPMFYIVDP